MDINAVEEAINALEEAGKAVRTRELLFQARCLAEQWLADSACSPAMRAVLETFVKKVDALRGKNNEH